MTKKEYTIFVQFCIRFYMREYVCWLCLVICIRKREHFSSEHMSVHRESSHCRNRNGRCGNRKLAGQWLKASLRVAGGPCGWLEWLVCGGCGFRPAVGADLAPSGSSCGVRLSLASPTGSLDQARGILSRGWLWPWPVLRGRRIVGGSLQAGPSRPRQSPALPMFLRLGRVGEDGTHRSVSIWEKPAPERVPGIRRGDGALTTGGPKLGV